MARTELEQQPQRIGRGQWLVPASRGGDWCVDLEEGGCTCPGFVRWGRCWYFWYAMYREVALSNLYRLDADGTVTQVECARCAP